MSLEAPSASRSPWQLLYGTAHRWRRRWHSRRAFKLPRPVVSVGNLHWGGSGKTPIAAAIARTLRDQGHHIVILSRGYGSEGTGIRVVSTGDGPLLGPRVAGDEPVLLAGELPGVSVVVGPDRYRAGLHAIERLPRDPDLFLLEDGFSHVRLTRDLDILTFPAADVFASGRLWPSGGLREPLASVRHADAVVLAGGQRPEGDELAAALRAFGFRGAGFAAAVQVDAPRIERGEELPSGARLLVVTGIARPDRVLDSLEELPYTVAGSVRFADHHPYPQASLERVRRAFSATDADWVVTTGKDHVKLLGRLDLPLAVLPLVAAPEAGFWHWLQRRLAEFRPTVVTEPGEAG